MLKQQMTVQLEHTWSWAGERLKRRSRRKNEAIILLYSIFRFGMVHYLCYFMLEIRMKNIRPFLLHYHQVWECSSKEFCHSLEHLLVCRSSSSRKMTAADSIPHFVCIFFFPIFPANALRLIRDLYRRRRPRSMHPNHSTIFGKEQFSRRLHCMDAGRNLYHYYFSSGITDKIRFLHTAYPNAAAAGNPYSAVGQIVYKNKIHRAFVELL